MFEAQILQAAMATTTQVYGPWMRRGGDSIIATLDVIKNAGVGTVSVDLFTKAVEDAGDGSAVSGTLTSTVTGRTSKEWDGGLKDLVRYRLKFAAAAEEDGWALFRMLQAIWFDSVDV